MLNKWMHLAGNTDCLEKLRTLPFTDLSESVIALCFLLFSVQGQEMGYGSQSPGLPPAVPDSLTLMQSPLTLQHSWSVWPIASCRSDGMSLWRLGHKRHCDFCFLLSPAQCWVTHSGRSRLQCCEHTRATNDEAPSPPTNSQVSRPCWKQLVWTSCLQTPKSLFWDHSHLSISWLNICLLMDYGSLECSI